MARRHALIAAAVGVLSTLSVPTAAHADSSVSINPGNVPTGAAGYGNPDCDPHFGGGPYSGKDVWVFNLPGGKDSGDFVTVTATFTRTGGGAVTTVIDAATGDGDGIVRKGTSKAWVVTPAGWTLTGATATITGKAKFFVLTHTCPAAGGGGTGGGSTPEATPPSTTQPATTPPRTTSPATTPGSTPDTPGNETTETTPPPGGLPVTGAAVTGIALAGAALIGAGGFAVLVMRRRREDHVFKA